jgi:transcription elongation factor SPT5
MTMTMTTMMTKRHAPPPKECAILGPLLPVLCLALRCSATGVLQDDDEDDDEDEDDDRRKRKSGKKRKKSRGSKYIDDVAGEDDSEEEDAPRHKKRKDVNDYDDDDAEMDEETQERMMSANMHRHRNLDILNMDEDTIKNRYRDQDYDDDDDDGAMDDHRQMAMLPDATKDPKVWSVRCANGQERQLVLQLMNKFIVLGKEKKPIKITSAYCNEHALGHIYIEARMEAFVREAISGLRGVYVNKMKLVPVTEMQATVTISKKKLVAEEGGWARMKRGKYKGDIVQVISTDAARNEVEVRIVPRVDTTDYSSINDEQEVRKRRRMAIPPRRVFDPRNFTDADLDKWGISSERQSDGQLAFDYDGMVFEINQNSGANTGFLVKKMTAKNLQIEDVRPELDELKMFEQATQGDEKPAGGRGAYNFISSIQRRKIVLTKGDLVRVKDGELRDVLGIVDSVSVNHVIIRPKLEDIKQKLSFPLDEVEKYFEQGEHVKVVAGRAAGVTGTVVRVEGERITILTDINYEEVQVFSSDVQETNEVSTGLDVVGQFKLHDLILLQSAAASAAMPSVGVIIKLEKNVLQVIDNNGKVRAVRPADAQPQKKSQLGYALDSEQRLMGQGDMVKITDGTNKGKQGTIRHIFRNHLFLHSPARMENSGIFVVKARQVSLMGQSKHTENAAPNLVPGGGMGMGPSGGRGFGPPGGRALEPMGMGMGRGRGRGMLEGKRVRIIRGFDKGKVCPRRPLSHSGQQLQWEAGGRGAPSLLGGRHTLPCPRAFGRVKLLVPPHAPLSSCFWACKVARVATADGGACCCARRSGR